MHPKFSDFVNSDDYNGKSTYKSIKLYTVLIQKRFEANKKEVISSKKIENYASDYNYAHSFFGEDF